MKGIWETDPSQTWPHWADIRAAGCNRIYFPALAPVYSRGELLEDDFMSLGMGTSKLTIRKGLRSLSLTGWTLNTRQVNPTYRAAVVSEQHFQYAIWRDPHQMGIEDPLELARLGHEDIGRATDWNKYLSCSYMFDIEFPYRDPAWLLACFKEFRRLRPGRLLAWTMEPFQGGWLGSPNANALIDWINHDVNMVVVPQCFYWDMGAADPESIRQNLIRAGFLAARVRVFLDAAKQRPPKWDGCLFHAQRLRLAF